MQNILLLINPVSGNGKAAKLLPAVRQVITGIQNINVQTEITKSAAHLCSLAATAHDGDIIAVLGGDGSVRDAYIGLGKRNNPILVLPTGTANVIARELGLPLDPLNAARTLADFVTVKWDVATINGSPVLFSASAGLDAEVVRLVSEKRTNTLRSRFVYVPPTIKAVFAYRPEPIIIHADGNRLPGRFHYFLALNCTRYAGSFIVAEDADPSDGKFDLLALRSTSPFDVIRYVLAGFTGSISRQRDIIRARFSELTVVSTGRVPLQVDGDPFGNLPMKMTLQGDTCSFIKPRKKK